MKAVVVLPQRWRRPCRASGIAPAAATLPKMIFARCVPISAVTTRYQITLEVADRAGVLAAIAGIFQEHGVSVETLEQTVIPAGAGYAGDQPAATLVIGTHEASEADLAATVASLTGNDVVHSVTSVLRVEGL